MLTVLLTGGEGKMKPVISILAMAIMVTVASAQTKTVAPAAGTRMDTAQQAPAMQCQQMSAMA
jgi:hypothetical protein